MYKKQIEEYFTVHKDELLKDICDIIRIKSDKDKPLEGMPFGEGPAAALAETLKIAGRMGFTTKNYENYVGAVDLNDRQTQLDILAHLDVVPAGDDWTVTKPYEPVVKDGKLYGRGSADDKGPAIAALYALKAVKDMNIPLKYNVRLVLGTDEECGSNDIKYYYQKEKEAPMTFSPDADFPVINIEKGGLSSTFEASWNEDKGLPGIISVGGGLKGNIIPDTARAVIAGISLEEANTYCEGASKNSGVKFTASMEGELIAINAKGISAHASTPEKGNNALTAIIELLAGMPFAQSEGFKRICAVNEVFPHGDWAGKAAGIDMSDELSGELTICLNIFEYSSRGLKGTIDCRAPICATNENLRDVLKSRLISHGIELAGKDIFPAHYVSGDSPFVHTLLKCYEEYSGLKGECIAIGGGTYVHSLKNGVAFGCTMPGTENHMHGADEFAVVDELLLSAKIFTQAIIDLCS